MRPHLSGVALLCLFALGCADRMVALTYQAPAARETSGPVLIVLPALDRRGDEGDKGDHLRVGGLYGGYGNRIAKVMSQQPWPPALRAALVAEFRAQGIAAIDSTPDRPALALETEVRNFSTEARWTMQAHIGAVFRVRAPDNRVLVEKKIEVRESGATATTESPNPLEANLNAAFDKFVKTVAADPDLRASIR